MLAVAQEMNNNPWLEGLREIPDLEVREDVLLAPMGSFRIGGPADVLLQPMSAAAVAEVQKFVAREDVPLTILGGGTNVLIGDLGIRGVVVDLSAGFNFLNETEIDEDTVCWHVGSGCGTGRIVRRSVTKGLLGAHVLAGVPGSMGGALIMNAGGHEGEIGEVVSRVQVARAGSVDWLTQEECGFEYRNSAFTKDTIVLSAELHLRRSADESLRETVSFAQKRRKATQPLQKPNAGSIFKNPESAPAGKLIEEAGCKGWQEGQAQVSPMHANFIVNLGGATAAQVLTLVQRVRARVAEEHGIHLQMEVKLLGDFGPEFESLKGELTNADN